MNSFFFKHVIVVLNVLVVLLAIFCLFSFDLPFSVISFFLILYIFFRGSYMSVQGIPREFRKAVRHVSKIEKELRNSNGKCVKMKKIKTHVSIYIFRDRYNQTERVVCYHLDGCAPAQKKYFMEFSHQLHIILAKTFPFHWDIQETVDSNLVPTIQ